MLLVDKTHLIDSLVMLIELTVKLTHEMLSTSAGQERLCDVQNRGVFCHAACINLFSSILLSILLT